MSEKEQETPPKLTDKQAAFVREYLIDLNATQAAIRAGYSQETARQIGCQNLTKVDIQDAIQAAQEERATRTKIDADWVLQRLALEAQADIADIYNENGSLKSVHEWPMVWRQGLVAGIDTHQEFEQTDEGKRPDGVVQKVKLSDRIKRLELIGKHVSVGAFSDKVEHTGEGGGPIKVEMSRQEKAKRITFALRLARAARNGKEAQPASG